MIKKNDILMYNENLEEGDDACLMLALEDEVITSKVPMIKTVELNTTLKCPPVNFFESKYYKVVGHANDSDSKESIVKRYLPQSKWNLR